MNQLPLNWFDMLFVIVLLLGMGRGRKRGMSQEWLVTLQWFVIVGVAPFVCRPLGDLLLKTAPLSRAAWYVVVYVATAIIVKIIFGFVRKGLPEKFAGASDAFGSAEYYLGMLAGMAKFTCILLAFMAVLNAPHYTVADIAADKAYDEKNWGSSFFPHIAGIQRDIFKNSFTGSTISQNADVLLIAKNEDNPKKKKDNLH